MPARTALVAVSVALILSSGQIGAQLQQEQTPKSVLDQYCVGCHSTRLKTGGLDLESLNLDAPGANAETWEKVIAKLRAGSMPPPGRPRPDKATYRAVASRLEQQVDRAWEAKPDPGRIAAVHRLNRAEYNNAIRDLLAIDFDAKPLLPGDETADGSFDNFADSLSISTAHLERYLSLARQVTRLAVGLPPARPGFAGDDSWEKYMQVGGDAGLEIRTNVTAGPHIVGVSFVRELWEPEGLPQPVQRGRVIANDQVYMDPANVGSVQIGGPYIKER